MSAPTRLLYRFSRLDPAPNPDAPWAITVQFGDDDPAPRTLAYARSEQVAQRICLALRQSNRTAREDNANAAATYVEEATDARSSADDA